jgi:hypothetical protein
VHEASSGAIAPSAIVTSGCATGGDLAAIPCQREIDTTGPIWYNQVHSIGMWLSLVERSVRDAEVVGSNPAIPTSPAFKAVCFRQAALCLFGVVLSLLVYGCVAEVPPPSAPLFCRSML